MEIESAKSTHLKCEFWDYHLFLRLEFCDQCTNMRRDLDGELITFSEILLRSEAMPHTGRGPGQNDCARQQCRSLRKERHNFWDGEDKATTSMLAGNGKLCEQRACDEIRVKVLTPLHNPA